MSSTTPNSPTTNGKSSSSPSASASTPDSLHRIEELVANTLLARTQLLKSFLDPRRDIDDECGYPSGRVSINPDLYQDLFDREGIATRVVQVLPRESWQVQPLVYEDEDAHNVTAFEQAWDALGSGLRGEDSWYQDEEGSPVWEYLRRADELSGIGQFGIILMGVDDGLPLDQPIKGFEQDYTGPYAGGGVLGTDQQYYQMTSPTPSRTSPSRTSPISPPPRNGGLGGAKGSRNGTGKTESRRLLFMRVFPESLVQITRFEANPASPRFGQPVMYLVTFNDPREQQSGIGLPLATVNVHWSRVIHVADNRGSTSEVFGVPRMRPVLNRLLDLRKLYSGSAEMYWRGAFPGYSLETHPMLGGAVEIDRQGLRDMWEEYQNGLQRALFLMGMSAKSLAPQVVDPSAQIAVQIEAICINLGIPKRVFMGSERGELASSQDDAAWNDRLKERQQKYITPRIIIPFVDRLIAVGVLPEPTVDAKSGNKKSNKKDSKSSNNTTQQSRKGYRIEWPDLTSQTDSEKAAVLLQRTQAYGAFVAGGVEAVIPPLDYMTRFDSMSEEEASTILDRAAHEAEDKVAQQIQQEKVAVRQTLDGKGGATPSAASAATAATPSAPAKETAVAGSKKNLSNKPGTVVKNTLWQPLPLINAGDGGCGTGAGGFQPGNTCAKGEGKEGGKGGDGEDNKINLPTSKAQVRMLTWSSKDLRGLPNDNASAQAFADVQRNWQRAYELQRQEAIQAGNTTEVANLTTKANQAKSIADTAEKILAERKQLAEQLETLFGQGSGSKSITESVASSVGAPDNAKVEVFSVGTNVHIQVVHPEYNSSRFAYVDGTGKKVMENNTFFMHGETGTGLGTKIFSDQVANLKANGFDRIVTHAAKGRDMNGFYTWPRMGYDQKVSDFSKKVQERIGKAFPEAKSVQDIMKTQEGRDWWKKRGASVEKATFDLKEGSRSMQIHLAYLEERAKRTPVKNRVSSEWLPLVMNKDNEGDNAPKSLQEAEEITLSVEDEAALERAWELIGQELPVSNVSVLVWDDLVANLSPGEVQELYNLCANEFNPDQLRDASGRWGSGGAVSSTVARLFGKIKAAVGLGAAPPALPEDPRWAAQKQFTNAGADSTSVRDYLSGSTTHDLHAGVASSRADTMLTSIMNEAGRGNPPELVGKDQMDKLAREGWTMGYRGVGQPQFAEQFRSGPLYNGAGSYGNGSYFTFVGGARNEKSAVAGATMYAAQNSTDGKGALVRIAFPPNARVVDFEKVKGEQNKYMKDLNDRVFKGEIPKSEYSKLRELYADIGRFAALRNYDAVRVKSEGFLLVLNRSKVVAQRGEEGVTENREWQPLFNSDGNCGTGSGGFQPGNTCGGGGKDASPNVEAESHRQMNARHDKEEQTLQDEHSREERLIEKEHRQEDREIDKERNKEDRKRQQEWDKADVAHERSTDKQRDKELTKLDSQHEASLKKAKTEPERVALKVAYDQKFKSISARYKMEDDEYHRQQEEPRAAEDARVGKRRVEEDQARQLKRETLEKIRFEKFTSKLDKLQERQAKESYEHSGLGDGE